MSLYGVIGYHVTPANHPIQGNTCVPSCGNFDLFVTNVFILYKGWYVTFNTFECFSQNLYKDCFLSDMYIIYFVKT